MADNNMMNTLRQMLGDNADEKIKNALDTLQGGGGGEMMPGDDGDYVNQIRNIVGRMSGANDTRSNLLLSLKPYMRAERQQSIDSAVKILNLTRLAGLFK